MEKKCFRCGEKKPLTEFYKHKGMRDGRLNKCKDCNKADVQLNYRDNIDHYKEYEKARAGLTHRAKARSDYASTEGGKEAGSRAKKAWTRRNPIKRMASQIVGNAVRSGKLIKPTNCGACNSEPERLHGHHDDYAFPLAVRWLCPGCHNTWHKKNGPGENAN